MSTKNKFEFDKVFDKLQQMKPKLPQEIAAIAQSSFVKNFNTESFFGKKWKEVQRRQEGTKAYKYPKKTGLSRRVKPILVDRGNLKREVNSSIKEQTWDLIRLGVDVSSFNKGGYNYAKAQNEGTANIPQREFMGNSPILEKKIKDKIRKSISEIFK
jgi:phage gpG-like protein